MTDCESPIFGHDRLERQVSVRQELVTAMAQAYEQARVDEVRNAPVITVIDQPESLQPSRMAADDSGSSCWA